MRVDGQKTKKLNFFLWRTIQKLNAKTTEDKKMNGNLKVNNYNDLLSMRSLNMFHAVYRDHGGSEYVAIRSYSNSNSAMRSLELGEKQIDILFAIDCMENES